MPGAHNLRTTQKANTRAMILERALELFNEVGFLGTTVEQIATAVGASRATFYLHFSDKEAVLSALVDDHLGRAVLQMKSLPGPAPTLKQITDWMNAMVKFVRKDSPWINLIIEYGAMQPSMPSVLQRDLDALTGALGENLPAFVAGAFGSDHESERRVTADLLIAQISWAARTAAHRSDKAYGTAAVAHVSNALFNFTHDERIAQNGTPIDK